MGIGDIFKTGQFKNEIEELKQENARFTGRVKSCAIFTHTRNVRCAKTSRTYRQAQLSKIIFGKYIKDIEADISRRVSNIENLDNEIRNREKQI